MNRRAFLGAVIGAFIGETEAQARERRRRYYLAKYGVRSRVRYTRECRHPLFHEACRFDQSEVTWHDEYPRRDSAMRFFNVARFDSFRGLNPFSDTIV